MSGSATDFDVGRLEACLLGRIDGFRGPVEVVKFPGGQSNPTYLLTAPEQRAVLRRKPFGDVLSSAHAIDREYKVMLALRETEVPVASPLLLCEDASIIGADFYVMSFEDGRIFTDPALPELTKGARLEVYQELVRTLAALHEVDVQAVGLSGFGKPGNYFERQLSRWTKQYRATETEHIDEVERLIYWLGTHIPADEGAARIIHGDYRLDNCIYDSHRPTIRAVLDWELSTLGHPMADIGHLCMTLDLPDLGILKGLGGCSRAELGVPSDEELIDYYCAARQISVPPQLNFYLAFAFFRYAAIAQGVFKRAQDGNASNTNALQMGAVVKPLAELALERSSRA